MDGESVLSSDLGPVRSQYAQSLLGVRGRGLVFVLNKFQIKLHSVMPRAIAKVCNAVFSLEGKIISRSVLMENCLLGNKSEYLDWVILKMIFIKLVFFFK